jgi:hypothetical protein
MLSKRQIAEKVIIRYSGGVPSSENNIDVRDVYDVVDMCYAQLAAQEVAMQIRGKGDFTIDSVWSKGYTKTKIKYDSELAMCYCELPATRVHIEGDKDIRLVSWVQSQDHPFSMEDSSAMGSIQLLECGQVTDGAFPFFVDGQRLWFRNMPKVYIGKKLFVRMIPNVDGYKVDEPLPIPSIFAYQLMDMVGAWFGVQSTTLSKNTNDANVNTK